MSARTSTKIPRLKIGSHARFESTVVQGTTATFTHHRNIKTHKLPGIGTYVIDTPKDSNLTAREKCFRYQEIHRGVSRSKLKSLPDIPKRYDMKSLPVAKLREIKRSAKSPFDDTWREVATPNVSENGSVDDSRSEKARKQDTTWKLPSQEELVSRSPIGRMEASITGFGVRKNKPSPNTKTASRHPHQHREFTYLSTNLALSEPEPAMVRATERELESQAEYRKQLTFYLSQMLHSENPTPQPDVSRREGFPNPEEELPERYIPYDYVGHSSKNQDWESNLRLGDMLINTTPDLRKKLKLDEKPNKSKDNSGSKKESRLKKQLLLSSPSQENNGISKSGSCNDINALDNSKLKDSSRNNTNTFLNSQSHNSHQSFQISPSTNLKRSNSFAGQQEDSGRRRATVTVPAGSNNTIEIVHHDEDGEEYYDDNDDDSDDDDAEKWREVVNMPVVEAGGYDRFANVKLPPSGRTQARGNEHKHLVPSHGSRMTGNANLTRGGGGMSISTSKHNSPFGLS